MFETFVKITFLIMKNTYFYPLQMARSLLNEKSLPIGRRWTSSREDRISKMKHPVMITFEPVINRFIAKLMSMR